MKRLLLLSGKGGTGKTTAAAAFIHFSRTRAIADCDVDAPNLHLVKTQTGQARRSDFMGGDKAVIDPRLCSGCGLCRERCRFAAVEPAAEGFRINEYACEGCGVCAWSCPEKAITLIPDVAGEKALYLEEDVFSTATLKMGRGNSGKLVTEVKLAMLKHAPDTELAIIDGSPGIGCPVIASVSGMDLVLVVAEPSLSGLSDLQRLVQTARSFQTPLAVCVNKWDVSPSQTQAIEDYCRRQQLPFLGTIPYDKCVGQAVNAGLSVAELDCPAARALKSIYENTLKLLYNEKE